MLLVWISFVLSALALAVSIISALYVRQARTTECNKLKKLADSHGASFGSALELMREETRLAAIRARKALQIAGLVTAAAGVGVLIFLRFLLGGGQSVYLCGLIPLFVGIALFGSSWIVKREP